MKPKQETNIKNHYDYDLADNFNKLAGGNKEKCEKIIENVSQKHVEHSTHLDGEVMGDLRHVNKIINIGDLERPAIDVKKLLIPLHVDRTLYQTEEELFKALTDWWINIKHRSPKTITVRIRHARNMSQHHIYPVNWLEFQPEQILNQMLFIQIYEYPEMAKEKGNPTYGSTQINNLWKTVRTFAESFGIDISYWGYSPPEPPEPQVKIVPRPKTVNKLIHNRYTWDYYTNALIKTILTVGFNAGLRPEELIIIKVDDVKFEEGYILIREQKKRFRERQIWIEDSVMNSRQQNSLKNWINIWRKKEENKLSGDILFIQKGGKPFPSEDALRMFLSPYCKQVWQEFCPKIMRDWSAIARLIRTKVETKKWDTRTVKNALGHKYEKTTESYIKFAEEYYRKDPYDWLRSVLKFHPHSKRMKQHYSSSQKNTVTLTNGKKWFIEELVSPVENDGPGGIRTRDL